MQAANNPFLQDHVIAGNQVFPTVCAIAWMVDAVESSYAGFKYYSFENYRLFKGIVFDNLYTEDYYIDLTLMEERDSQLRVAIKISSLNAKNKPVFHYSAELILLPEAVLFEKRLVLKKMAIEIPEQVSDLVHDDAKDLYKDGTLFHGASLQGIQQIIDCDHKGLLLACQINSMAEDKQGEFAIKTNNIFVNDLVYQSMLVWVKKQLGLGSLPSSTKAWNVYAEITPNETFYLKLDVVEQKQDKLVADITLISSSKKVLAEIRSAEVTVSESLNNLFMTSPSQ